MTQIAKPGDQDIAELERKAAEDDPTIVPRIDAFASAQPWPLDSFQREALLKLEMSRALLVSAPTSSGKTLVAEYRIWCALECPPSLRGDTSQSRGQRLDGRDEVHGITVDIRPKLTRQTFRDVCERKVRQHLVIGGEMGAYRLEDVRQGG